MSKSASVAWMALTVCLTAGCSKQPSNSTAALAPPQPDLTADFSVVDFSAVIHKPVDVFHGDRFTSSGSVRFKNSSKKGGKFWFTISLFDKTSTVIGTELASATCQPGDVVAVNFVKFPPEDKWVDVKRIRLDKVYLD